jgi:hypothetical protein
VLHGDRLAIGIEPDPDLLVGQGAGEIHLHVIFAGIDQLHRLADHLGRGDRRMSDSSRRPKPPPM